LARISHRQHVILRAGPPDADEVLHREADVRGFLDRDLVHHAPAPHQHVVGPITADLQPLRLLLLTGMVDRQQAQLVAVLLRQLFQRADRLLAVGRVVIDQRDRLARQIAAVDVQQVLHRDRGAIPVVGRVVEHPLEDLAVLGRGPAIAHRVDRDAVGRGLGDQLVGDPGRERLVDQAALALGRLVALDALLGVVAGLAFEKPRRDAPDPAVTLVHQRQVVGVAVGEGNPVRGVGAGPVAQRREHELRHRGRRGHYAGKRHGCQFFQSHWFRLLPWKVPPAEAGASCRHRNLNTGTAKASVSPWPVATAAPARAALRSGT
jgi:hypothetical protein